MKPFRIEFDMTTADMLAVADVIADRYPALVRQRQKQRVTFVLLGLATIGYGMLLDLVNGQPDPMSLTMIFFGILMMCFAAILGVRHRQSIRRQIAFNCSRPEGQAYLGRRTIEFGPDGLAVTTPFTTSHVSWRGVFDLIPTDDHLFLVIPGPAYLAVPRRAFEHDADFDRFVDGVVGLCSANGGLATMPVSTRLK